MFIFLVVLIATPVFLVLLLRHRREMVVGERVFVVCGSSHAVLIRPALPA